MLFLYLLNPTRLKILLIQSHWLRLDQISVRNFDKSARRFLLVKNLCSFIFRWIRFFISSCFAIARLQCEDKIKDSHVCDCLCLGCFLYIQLRLTQKCSLFGHIFFVRWIRFFIASGSFQSPSA